jgi:hypothetical protein
MSKRPLQDVLNEIGQRYAADLDGRQLLVLVFSNEAERQEFVALVEEAKPGMAEYHIPESGPPQPVPRRRR